MKTAVIYARVSSTTDRQTTDRQINDLKKYAEVYEYDVKEIYSEKISGAKENKDRDVLNNCIDYCIKNGIDVILVSELSRLGRQVMDVLETVKKLEDNGINLYCQKEQFLLLDENKKLSTFAPIMIATLATCAQIERENIKFRLNSGRAQYIANGGKLGRKHGSTKTDEQILSEYPDVVKYLKAGKYSVREIAKLTGKSPTTVQKIKQLIK